MKRARLRRQLVSEHAEREHVAAAIDARSRGTAPAPCTPNLPLTRPACGLRRARRRLRDAEVDQLHRRRRSRRSRSTATRRGGRCRAACRRCRGARARGAGPPRPPHDDRQRRARAAARARCFVAASSTRAHGLAVHVLHREEVRAVVCSPTSNTCAMCWWCSVASSRASSRNIAMNASSSRRSAGMRLEHDVALEATGPVTRAR